MMLRKFGVLLLAVVALSVCASGCSKRKPYVARPVDGTNGIPSGDLSQQMGRPKEAPEDAPGMAEFRANMKTVYFDYDKSELSSDQKAVLANGAAYLQSKKSVRVIVEGHCDKRGSVEYNFSLGQRRADVVRAFLVEKGVSASRITTLSKGSEVPAVVGDSEAAFAKNRRAEFKMGAEESAQ
jgi:peptidoglycan-associated lipoprotein